MRADFDQLPVEALVSGIVREEQPDCYCCIHCQARFWPGEIYEMDGRYFEAEKAAQRHLQKQHGDRLEALLYSGSRYLPLTGNQRQLLCSLHRGESDQQIARESGISPSTVRHQRFTLRERAKQARLFLAVYTLATQKKNQDEELIEVHDGARMVDERYEITAAEREKFLHDAFQSLQPPRLQVFPRKEKKKVVILARIAEEFEQGRVYSEPEVNAILRPIYPDYATIRRYLIEYGFMQRTPDCRAYQVVCANGG